MGKQWKKANKLAKAGKKSQLFHKLSKEIQVAVRLGGGNPETNYRLKLALESGKDHSLPKETIQRALLKGAGAGEGDLIEEVTYEGFSPHRAGVIAEGLTNNRARTISEIRTLFHKHKGRLGETGSASWLFERGCLITGQKNSPFDEEEEAIEVGADRCFPHETDKTLCSFFGPKKDLEKIREKLIKRDWFHVKARMFSLRKEKTKISSEELKDILLFLEDLENHEDILNVYSTVDDL